MLLFFVFVCWAVVAVVGLEEHFGSKSPYRAANEPPTSNLNYTAVFLLSRHGSRFPTTKHLKQYSKLGKNALLVNWTFPEFNSENEGLLTQAGKLEMKRLGQLTKVLFASLFVKPAYHPREFELRSSKVIRTLQSASAFASGLFGQEEPFAIESESLGSDLLLRFHENCLRYQATKKDKTPSVDGILAPVLSKLHKKFGGLELSVKQVKYLWSACMFQGVGQPNSACQYFDKQDAELLEFANDVGDFWEKAFGSEINYAMSCPLLEHIIESIDLGKRRFLFGHAENIMPVMTALGYFKEDPEMYQAGGLGSWRERKWRSGLVSPFGANLFVATYADKTGERFVQLWHNGVLLSLAHLCNGKSTDCPWSEFKASLQANMGACNFSSICAATPPLDK
ncbi:hypothetical protein BASA81_000372 [Batrachochytrium salamandrivorans]|nr:hypothetical protein BASA81_000372 [Batrachochytrium salamandrivorans]